MAIFWQVTPLVDGISRFLELNPREINKSMFQIYPFDLKDCSKRKSVPKFLLAVFLAKISLIICNISLILASYLVDKNFGWIKFRGISKNKTKRRIKPIRQKQISTDTLCLNFMRPEM